MNYTTAYSLGDTVWMVRDESFSRIVKCMPCGNSGSIKIGDESFICPKCGGRSAHAERVGTKFYVYGSSTVGQVSITDSDYKHREEPNPRITYMLHRTGVGSGQVWDQERLFRTQREAQEFCDVRNSLLPSDECELRPAPVDNYGKVRV
jgi:predicted RNA-binding Zn-ribbon protein involved in translation (DUF1610 family)